VSPKRTGADDFLSHFLHILRVVSREANQWRSQWLRLYCQVDLLCHHQATEKESYMHQRILCVLAGLALIAMPAMPRTTLQAERESDGRLPVAYNFQPFEVCPGCSTQPGGINDEGLVGATSFPQGYLYNVKTNQSTVVPGALALTVPRDNGEVPGIAFSPMGTIVPFVRKRDASVDLLAGFPGALITAILQFNEGGESVGWASNNFVTFFGFIRSQDGVYTGLDCPFALALGTFPLGLTEDGTIVGYTTDSTETDFIGFIRSPDGTWREFAIPGATSTIPFAMNERNVIVGGYRDATGWHGFAWFEGTFRTIDAPGASNTNVTGINNRGMLVGNTFIGPHPLAGPFAAFVARPAGSTCSAETQHEHGFPKTSCY
jgi:hypothetical protein